MDKCMTAMIINQCLYFIHRLCTEMHAHTQTLGRDVPPATPRENMNVFIHRQIRRRLCTDTAVTKSPSCECYAKERYSMPSASAPKCISSAKVSLMTDLIRRHWTVCSEELRARRALPREQIPTVGKAASGRLPLVCSQQIYKEPGPHNSHLGDIALSI